MITVLILAALMPALAVAAEYRCPRPDGASQLIKNDRYIALKGISLYDGHPDEMAQLKPDNAEDDATGPGVWPVEDISPRAYWMVCEYEQGIRYLRRLPVIEKRCTEIMGGILPLGLECR